MVHYGFIASKVLPACTTAPLTVYQANINRGKLKHSLGLSLLFNRAAFTAAGGQRIFAEEQGQAWVTELQLAVAQHGDG